MAATSAAMTRVIGRVQTQLANKFSSRLSLASHMPSTNSLRAQTNLSVERRHSSASFHINKEWTRQRIAILTEPGGVGRRLDDARFVARVPMLGGEGEKTCRSKTT
jgi:hypothetical protein